MNGTPCQSTTTTIDDRRHENCDPHVAYVVVALLAGGEAIAVVPSRSSGGARSGQISRGPGVQIVSCAA
jgi:hypothetical protein